MLEYPETERPEGERRERRIKGPNKVLVEPLRLLYLETYSFDRFELFGGKVYDKADTEIIEPLIDIC